MRGLPAPRPTRRAWPLLLLVAALGLFAGLALAIGGSGPITTLDHELAAWLARHAGPALTRWMSVVSGLHRPGAIMAGGVGVALVLLWRRDAAGLLVLLPTLAGGAALNHLLKHGFMRPRPGFDAAAAAGSDFSFPSGHVANATLLYGVLAALIACRSRSRALRVAAVLGAALLVLLVAASRLVLGAHYLSDVLAAAALALACLAPSLVWLGPAGEAAPAE